MKCPKCAYVGFEPAPRCRHCGYEFSLLPDDPPTAPLVDPILRERIAAAAPPAIDDLPLADDAAPAADLPLETLPARLPSLFTEPPPPARAPLAVRKTTAERPRSRPPAGAARPRPVLVERPEIDPAPASELGAAEDSGPAPAPLLARAFAALIDVTVLAGLDVVILYLTLQFSRLSMDDLHVLPLVPMAAFIGGLNLAYLVVFTAQGGQTLGKMAAGVRVESADGPLTTGAAAVRVLGAVVGGLVVGAGWWMALARADRRAAHDHLARTRVVKVAA